MNTKPLTIKEAADKLSIEMIENGIGTQAVHETVVAYRANRRAGTHSTLTKAGVNRSGKKPWRQKGTGRARAGYASSPVWRGGGVVFGPHPRDYSKKIPKKVKQLALRKAISARVGEGAMLLVSSLSLSKPKTADLIKQINGLMTRKSSLLIVLDTPDKNIYLAARNHPRLETTTGDQVNAEDILGYDKVIVTEKALTRLAERLKKKTKFMREAYDIVRTMKITEKATALNERGQYVFDVSLDATKQEIKYAVQQLYKKTVERVNTMRVQGKRRRKRTAQEGRTRSWKKAIVTLKAGEKIELV